MVVGLVDVVRLDVGTDTGLLQPGLSQKEVTSAFTADGSSHGFVVDAGALISVFPANYAVVGGHGLLGYHIPTLCNPVVAQYLLVLDYSHLKHPA